MISIFTPSHLASSKYLVEAYITLCEQTYTDWQWVIGINNGGYVISAITADPRVKVIKLESNKIGYLKKQLVLNCDGDLVVELDADDMLTPNCLEEINNAFKEDIVFAYSNCAEFYEDTWLPRTYSTYYGWRTRPFTYKGHDLLETLNWEPSAQMMQRIEWAPNHVRVFKKSAYLEIGGHNEELASGDDHELLCRMYIHFGTSKFKLIDKCLYLYRVHNNNTSIVENSGVQDVVHKNYLKYSRDIATRWAKDNNLRLLDLGGRFNKWPEYENVDIEGGDIVTDLNDPWPFEDNSVGVINASNIFEHLKDPIHSMNEAYRVLAPGGFLYLEVPSTDGRGAFQDPTHVSFWNEHSMWYYYNDYWARFIRPKYKGRFQNRRTITYFPDEFSKNNNICYVQADLIALKGSYSDRPVGEILI